RLSLRWQSALSATAAVPATIVRRRRLLRRASAAARRTTLLRAVIRPIFRRTSIRRAWTADRHGPWFANRWSDWRSGRSLDRRPDRIRHWHGSRPRRLSQALALSVSRQLRCALRTPPPLAVRTVHSRRSTSGSLPRWSSL